MERDVAYFTRRMAEERLRAIDAAHPKVREVHLELAERYEHRLGEFATREQERSGLRLIDVA